MFKLERGLKEWVSAGIINAEQASRIRTYESSRPESSWILTGLVILGAVIIGIGIVSVIAANWAGIPDALKLTVDFLILAGLALATLQAWETHKTIHFEALLIFFIILCLASIGLISQIYHTGGTLYQALLLWAGMTFPAMLAAKHRFAPMVWTGGFLLGFGHAATDSITFMPLFQKNYHAVYMIIPLLCAVLAFVSKRLSGESAPTRSFFTWTVIAGLLSLVVAETFTSSRDSINSTLIAYIPGHVCAALTLFFIGFSSQYRKIQRLLLLSAVGTFLISFHLPMLKVQSSVAFAVFTIATLGLMAVFLASLKKRFLFQCFLFLVGLRFLVLYFQAFGGLAATGFGLILSGGMVISFAILWNKYRKPLAAWAERWSQ